MNNNYQRFRNNNNSRLNLINTHFENINILTQIIRESQYLLENNNNNYNQYYNQINRNNRNNRISRNNETNNPTYILRFDSLFQTSEENSNSQTERINNYNSTLVNIDNSYVLLEDNYTDISQTHLLDIEEFQYIPNPINDICPITRERFYNNQNVLMIHKCKHIFNKSSLLLWLNNNNSCPSCRTNII